MMRLNSLPQIESFADALALADRCPNENLAHNTLVWTSPDRDAVFVKHFKTNILRFTPNGIVVDTRGHQTMTTKRRLNALLPSRYYIVQRNWEWRVWDRTTDSEQNFSDSMILSY